MTKSSWEHLLCGKVGVKFSESLMSFILSRIFFEVLDIELCLLNCFATS